MTITLAYSNDLAYITDLDAGIKAKAVTSFTLEVADTTVPTSASGTPLLTKQLDGGQWELPVNITYKQQIQTHANLVLAGTTAPGFLTYKQLLETWYYAKVRWISTDYLTGANKLSATRVVRAAEELSFEQVENVSFAVRTTFDVQTAEAVDLAGAAVRRAHN